MIVKAIVVAPGKAPEVRDVEDRLENWQQIVGGYIETLRIRDKLLLVCNEEGKLQELEFNRIVDGHAIVGTFFLVRYSVSGEFVSVKPDDINAWTYPASS